MGRSDWRDAYVFNQFVREAREAGRAAGAYDAGPPVVVGHSFGGRVAMGLARDFGDELMGAVMVDPPFFAPQNVRPPSPPRPTRRAASSIPWRRSSPVSASRRRKSCENLFILDFIARRSAVEVVDAEGKHGWALVLRSALLGEVHPHRPDLLITAARSPLALIRGAKSQLFHPEDAAYLLSLIAPGSPYVEIPEAEHHVMIDQPLAFVAALRALLAAWP